MPARSKPSRMFKRQQSCQTLPIGRAFPEADAPVGGADGRFPGAMVSSQVGQFETTAGCLDGASNRLGDGAFIEGRFAAFSDALQCTRQPRVAEKLARFGRASLDGQLFPAKAHIEGLIHRRLPDREQLAGRPESPLLPAGWPAPGCGSGTGARDARSNRTSRRRRPAR